MLCRIHLARRFAVALAPMALAVGLVPLQAAAIPPVERPQLAQAEISGFSEAQLESYAAAVLQVQEVDRTWRPRIDQAGTEAEAEELTVQATDEMIGAIESEGLSVEEYNAITLAAQSDERLYEHILALLTEAQ
jgi:hypothetical protein